MTDSLGVKFIQAIVILGIPSLKKDLGHWLKSAQNWDGTHTIVTNIPTRLRVDSGFTPRDASCRPIPSIPMFTYDLQTS